MSISYDGDIGIGSLTVQELVGLSEDQIKERIATELPDLSSTEVTEYMEELREELGKIEAELKELQDGYEDDLDTAQDEDNVSSASRYESKLEDVDEALDTLDRIDSATMDALDHELLLNIESADDINWPQTTDATAELKEGDTVNIKATGGTGESIFTEEDEETEYTDTSNDGFITYDETVAATNATVIETAQDIYITAEAVQYVSYVNGIATFKVTVDGKTITMNIEASPNFPNLHFYGTNYLDTATLSAWNEDLLKHCFDNNDAVSFYDHLNEDDVTTEERLEVIDGYDEVIASANFDSAWSFIAANTSSADTDIDTTLSAETARGYYTEAINQLFGWIDDTSVTKDMIAATWIEIIRNWETQGLSGADISALIQSIVLGVTYQGSSALFSTFFASVLPHLEGYLEADKSADSTNSTELDTVDKMVIMLLETQSPASTTEYGGTAILTNDTFATDNGDGTYTDGEWVDHEENIDAINLLKSTLMQSTWAQASGSEDTTIETEQAALDAAASVEVEQSSDGANSHGYNVTFGADSDFYAHASEYAKRFVGGVEFDACDKDQLIPVIKDFADMLVALGSVDVDVMREAILAFFGTIEDGVRDNAVTVIMIMLHDFGNDVFDGSENKNIFWVLSRSKDFRDKTWAEMDDLDNHPDGWKYLADWWNNADGYEGYYDIT